MMIKGVFGQAVTAIEVERLPADTGPAQFVRLCGALIGKVLTDHIGSSTLPEISERINVPDGGVDADYTTPGALSVPETGGLIGPGRTVFQFKYRDVRAADQKRIFQGIVQKLRIEFPRVAPSCDRYVLFTNLELSGTQPRRLREALLESYPAFVNKPIVIWGAAEIALALNLTPHLRHLFFAQGGLCTLDLAEDELKAAYRRIGWPSFVNREEELAAIEAFVKEDTARLLQIQGPKYVGKTRLVIEALRPFGARIVWAAAPEAASVDLFRDLDSSDAKIVLVVDRCDPVSFRDIAERARERERLKTIIIGLGPERQEFMRDTEVLPVGTLDDQRARELLAAVTPGLPFMQQSWLVEAGGGFPGLLLHVGALFNEARLSPGREPDEIREQLGLLLEEQYLSELDPEARRALQAASLLPVLGIEGEPGKEMEAIARALGLSPSALATHLPTLEQMGFIRHRGRFREVIPPRLAEHLASNALTRPERILAELQVALEPGAFLRFLERFRELSNSEVKEAIARLFSTGGWFDTLQALLDNAKKLEILAPAAPSAALRSLERVLDGVPAEVLASQITGDARRALVWTLEDLALRSETFEGATRLLLALAAAENEKLGNNATGVFVSLFHWDHPEIPVSLSQRLGVLKAGARLTSPGRRRIVAAACGEVFRRSSVWLHHPKGSALPEAPYRAETWEEVRGYASGIQELLISLLLEDADPDVRQVAVSAFLDSMRQSVRLSLTSDGFHALGVRVFETAERIGREAPSASLRSRVVSELELILEDLTESKKTGTSGALEEATRRAKDLLEALTARTFQDRLWRWIGPASWSLEARADEAPTREPIRNIARELAKDPGLFERHLEWLLSDEAQQRISLFTLLGLEDRGGEILEMLTRCSGSRWPEAFGTYMAGWHEVEPARAASALDRFSESSEFALGIVLAACRLPPSPQTVERLVRLASDAETRTPEVVGEIAWSAPWRILSAAMAEQLLKALDDGSPEARTRLLLPLVIRTGPDAEMTPALRDLAWSFLASTSAARRDWDMLAARLGREDPGRLLRLIGEKWQELADQEPLHSALPLAWGVLMSRDRPGLILMLLRLAIAPEASHWIGWELSRLVDPSQDREVLLDFARRTGVQGARLIARHLGADKPGFWELARDLTAGWDDEEVRQGLWTPLLSGEWSGSAVPMITARITGAKGLLNHSNPNVARWAQQAVSLLEEWCRHAERQDQEEWIWDYKIRRSELEGMVRQKDSPERLWAIGRLLKDAPRERVLDLLTPAEILDALPKIQNIDERTRQMWEAYARHWSKSH